MMKRSLKFASSFFLFCFFRLACSFTAHHQRASLHSFKNKRGNEFSLPPLYFKTEQEKQEQQPSLNVTVLPIVASDYSSILLENQQADTERHNHYPRGKHDSSSMTITTQILPKDFEERKGFDISDVAKARLLLFGAAALYGTNFSLVKLLGDKIPVEINLSLRFGLAALFTLPWLFHDVRKQEGALEASWLGFEVGLLNSIGYIFQAVGLETTPASESAFICSLAVVVVPMLDFVSGKLLLPRQWMGATLALIGVAFLEMGGDLSFQSMTYGDALSLVQPFAFGFGFWKMEWAMQRFPDQAPRMTAAQLLAVFVASLLYGLLYGTNAGGQSYPWMEWFTDPSILIGLVWTGVITTALSIYMENLALETLSATETTLIFTTEPLWGTAFAVTVMGEEFGFNAAVGASLIISACIYSNLGCEGVLSIFQGCYGNQGGDSEPLISLSKLSGVSKRLGRFITVGLDSSIAFLSPKTAIAAGSSNEEVNEALSDLIQRILEKLQ
jgi:drug/metabolite transporter (DMT)-like permease